MSQFQKRLLENGSDIRAFSNKNLGNDRHAPDPNELPTVKTDVVEKLTKELNSILHSAGSALSVRYDEKDDEAVIQVIFNLNDKYAITEPNDIGDGVQINVSKVFEELVNKLGKKYGVNAKSTSPSEITIKS